MIPYFDISKNMESSVAIDALAALAHPTRLALFRLLARAGADGVAAGILSERLGVAPSTLSHHLATLERSGLIRYERRQRHLIYRVDPAAVRGLIAFLVEDCCDGRPELCGLPAGCEPDGP
jgi:ArsR family transcriptional regulator